MARVGGTPAGPPALPTRRPLIAGALLLVASLLVFWPGIATYDTVAQYGQVLSGQFDDWHPPAMARLWALLAPLAPGAAPLLVLQLAGYWTGLALIAAGLGGRGGALVIVIGLLPPFLGWQAVVLKDAQMVGAMLAATGLVARPRLQGRRVPIGSAVAAGVLLAYAALVRANAVFAVVPLAVALLPAPRTISARVLLAIVATVATLAIASPINHGLMGASRSGVERTGALYDLAGVAVRTRDAAAVGLAPAAIATLVARRCVKPFFWDPLGEPKRCDATIQPWREVEPGRLYARLAAAAARHPGAYLAHRLGHLNSTERWLVPAHWPGAAPPAVSERNDLGLRAPGAIAERWQRLAGAVVETPLGWPCVWLAAALAGLVACLCSRAAPARDLALALFVSAAALEASFAAISIASDVRYHLWPMIAAALGWVLLAARERLPRGTLGWTAALLAIVIAPALIARAILPAPPQSYQEMLAA